ncbi:MAG TPA: uracil-DNA glycosylase family protein [Rhodocyclaceae bacterium]|nr:uracil-DNA glycosylase family protein [Rhodocyclaceae bacterium]
MERKDTRLAELLNAARSLSDTVGAMHFAPPVSHVYNPLDYGWDAHAEYLERYGRGRKRVIFLGMNPGPFGMVQTGVPFGEVAAVRDWMGIDEDFMNSDPAHKKIKPTPLLVQNPKRPIEGFTCPRSEVSGRRLWGLFAQRFGTADAFFAEHFVANYCPLAIFDGGKNLTPDKLPAAEQGPLLAACDLHLRRLVEIQQPEWLIGVGAWAETRAREALQGIEVKFGRVLHPSPASPAANRGWAEAATKQLLAQGVWPPA